MGSLLTAVRRVGASVFITDETRAGIVGWVVMVAGAISLSVVIGFRASTTPITTTVWAEDGREFLAGAVRDGVLGHLFAAYAGYAHLLPRLLAGFASGAPVEAEAAVLAVMSCATTGILGVFCARASAPHITTPVGRAGYAATFALLPVLAIEVLGNLANLHWFLFVGAFWALVWRPTSKAGVVASCCVIVLAVLSDPLVLLLVPLGVWRAVCLATFRERLVVYALALGGVLQVWVVTHAVGPSGELALSSLPRLFAQRIVLVSLLGVRATTNLIDALGDSRADLLAVVAVVVLGWGVWRTYRHVPWFAVTAAAFASALFASCLAVRGGSGEVVFGAIEGGSRYSVAPLLLLAGPMIAVVERWRRAFQVGVVCVAALVSFVDLRPHNLRAGDLTWARGVAIARTECRAGMDPARIPILPVTPNDEWQMVVPCSYVQPRK
jgi:hypothetical protein